MTATSRAAESGWRQAIAIIDAIDPDAALSPADRAGADRTAALAHRRLAEQDLMNDRRIRAGEHAARAAALFQRAGRPVEAVECERVVALVARAERRHDRARRLLERALRQASSQPGRSSMTSTREQPVILADTSAWVEFDRATGGPADLRIAELIGNDGPLAVTEPVIMEVLAGARDGKRENDLRRLLLRFPLIGFDAAVDFDAAVRVYRRCRSVGVTPLGMVDCMIVAVGWRNGSTILTTDVDLVRVAAVLGVGIDPASAR